MTSDFFRDTRLAIKEKKAIEVLETSGRLLSLEDTFSRFRGYLLRGHVFEYGGGGIKIDLQRAIADYRSAAILIRNSDPAPLLYLARAHMKQGSQEYPVALKYIREADSVEHTPEVDLAYAYFYETMAEPNFDAAKKHFLKAALSGRFAGFFGYAEVLRKTENRFFACMVDCIRVLLGPLLFLVLGKRASQSFNGY